MRLIMDAKSSGELMQPANEEDHSLGALCLPALTYAGVQVAWAIQVGHFTAHLRKLGLPDRFVALAWLGGPLSGIFVQPMVGLMSDRCTSSLGRRRPFILGGSFFVIMMMMLFAWSGRLGEVLGDPVSASGGGSRSALVIAIVAFWGLDVGINVLSTPIRALLADAVPQSKLATGNALFAMSTGGGKAVGYALGAFGGDIRVINGGAALCVLLLSCVTSAFMREEPMSVVPNEENRSMMEQAGRAVKEIVGALVAMPRAMRRAFVVQWLTHLSLEMAFIYLADFAGVGVYGGDADAPPMSKLHQRFIDGVAFANCGLLGMALLCMLVAPFLPYLTKTIGMRLLWGGSLYIMGMALAVAAVVKSSASLMVVALATGVPLALAFSLPWTTVALTLTSSPLAERRALFLAAFNMSQVTPGAVSCLLGGVLVHLGDGSLAPPLGFAGVTAIIAAIATVRVDVPVELGGKPKVEEAAVQKGGIDGGENGEPRRKGESSVDIDGNVDSV